MGPQTLSFLSIILCLLKLLGFFFLRCNNSSGFAYRDLKKRLQELQTALLKKQGLLCTMFVTFLTIFNIQNNF